jgi:hypothetical protein
MSNFGFGLAKSKSQNILKSDVEKFLESGGSIQQLDIKERRWKDDKISKRWTDANLAWTYNYVEAREIKREFEQSVSNRFVEQAKRDYEIIGVLDKLLALYRAKRPNVPDGILYELMAKQFDICGINSGKKIQKMHYLDVMMSDSIFNEFKRRLDNFERFGKFA